MVEGELEVFRALVHQYLGEFVSVIVHPASIGAEEGKVVVNAVVGAAHHHFPVVVGLIPGHQLHLHGSKHDGRHPAGGIAVGEGDPAHITAGATQAVDDVRLIQAKAVFAHGLVENGG